MKIALKWMLIALMGLSVVAADAEAGCGPRPPMPPVQGPCGGGVRVNVAWGGHGGGHGGGYGGGYYGGRPFYGGGRMAYNRGRRLHRRARRAAWWGFYGRANRLHWRGNAAYARGNYRNARWY